MQLMFSSFCLFNYCTVRAFPLTSGGMVWLVADFEALSYQVKTTFLIRDVPLENALTDKCFTFDVTGWCLFFISILLLFF